MKRIIPFLFVTMFVLAACGGGAESYATPTSGAENVIDVAGTMAMVQMNANATEQALGIAYTATQQAVVVTLNAQATQVAAQTTEQARRDAIATDNRMRQDAAATQARLDAVSTAEQGERYAIGSATAQMGNIYAAATQTAWPIHAAWTQQAVIIDQALATNQVALSNLEVEQQREKNTPEWFIPLLIAVAATAAGVFYLVRHSYVREIRNPDTGAVEGIIFNNRQVVVPQLLTGPVLNVGKVIDVPLLADPEVMRREQMIRALQAMPTQNPTPMASGMMQNVFGGQPASRFEVLDASDQPPAKLMDPQALSAIEQDWKEEA